MPRNPVSADQPPATGPVSPWLDTAAAARYLRKEPGTLKGWRSLCKGPAFQIVSGRFVRYHINDLEIFEAAQALTMFSAAETTRDQS